MSLRRFVKNLLRFCYTSSPNLSNKLVRAKLKQHKDHSSTTISIPRTLQTKLCTQKSCPIHNRLIKSTMARSHITKTSYSTNDLADCNTKFIIYLIQCKKCHKQYIEQTAQPLRNRLSRHIQKIKDTKEHSIIHEHFRPNKCSSLEHLSVQILDVIDHKNHKNYKETELALKRRESLWINRLRSEYLQGLNQLQYDATIRYKSYK